MIINYRIVNAHLFCAGILFIVCNLFIRLPNDQIIRSANTISLIFIFASSLWIFGKSNSARIKFLITGAAIVLLSLPLILTSSSPIFDRYLSLHLFAYILISFVFLIDEWVESDLLYKYLVIGGIINTFTLLLQKIDVKPIMNTIYLSNPYADVVRYQDLTRFPGMHGHPNATMAVIAICMSPCVYLYEKSRNKAYILVYFVCMVTGAYLTYTRSPVIASAVALLTYFVFRLPKLKSKELLFMGTALIIVAAYIIPFGPPGGWERWLDGDSVSDNGAIRRSTILDSFNLILKYPFGLGLAYPEYLSFYESGRSSTHNAIIQYFLIYGILPAILLFSCIIILFLKSHIAQKSIILNSIILLMFEEHFNNPAFFWPFGILCILAYKEIYDRKEKDIHKLPL